VLVRFVGLLRREKSRSSWQLFCSVCLTVRYLNSRGRRRARGRGRLLNFEIWVKKRMGLARWSRRSRCFAHPQLRIRPSDGIKSLVGPLSGDNGRQQSGGPQSGGGLTTFGCEGPRPSRSMTAISFDRGQGGLRSVVAANAIRTFNPGLPILAAQNRCCETFSPSQPGFAGLATFAPLARRARGY
jgi:hypothetical protein